MKRIITCAALIAAILCFTIFSGCKTPQTLSSKSAVTREKVSEAGNGKLVLYFIDLDVPKDSKDKSGDSTLVVSPDGKIMLIDCGHPDAGKDVIKTLDALGITKIDMFVMSHPHIDHLGAFPLVASRFPIGLVYRSRLEYDTQYMRAFEEAVKNRRIPVEYLEEGDSFLFGDKVKVEVFGPEHEIVYPKNYPSNSTQFVNDNSVTMMLIYGESKALFGGDLYRSGETVILDKYKDRLKCDVAKVNHHALSTSSKRGWIKATRPQIAVAMNDVLGSMDVVNDYVKNGARFYHTLYNGSVKIELDDKCNIVTVTAEKESWIEKLPEKAK
ncbi:MBL fold metallo-hydrolase [Treponema sp. OMZ 840]|uniref:ComEC/Rec2 family competence protein n=1 Tax=Treponema sp. OMZ 840 TaxID=244313 RepID=UPI003D8EA598